MSKDSTTANHIAEAILALWDQGKKSPTVREITAQSFKDMPPSAPLMQIVRNQVGTAVKLLASNGLLAHPVTAYYYRLPVRNRTTLIPVDTVNRRKCVPLAAGPKGTHGVRIVETTDDPLLIESIQQSLLMTAGSVNELEKKQRQAGDSGLLTKPLADVRDPAWFDQTLLSANPQMTLPLGADSDGEA